MKIASILVWDEGTYDGKVSKCESDVSTLPGREGQQRFKWTLRLKSHDGEEFNDVPYWTGVTMSTHPSAKLRPFVKALAPELDLTDPQTCADLDTDMLVGRGCRVVLGVNEEKGQNTVDKVMAAPKKGAAKAAPVAVADEAEEESPGF